MTAVAPAALERLATALGAHFSTTLIQGEERRPRLVVVDRRTRAATEVYADDRGWLWWPWAEPAAVTDDPQAAARRVTAHPARHSPSQVPAVTGPTTEPVWGHRPHPPRSTRHRPAPRVVMMPWVLRVVQGAPGRSQVSAVLQVSGPARASRARPPEWRRSRRR
ncbi:MAG TPA: hypothetical protein VGS62_08520 [Streptosporangiaceae bacterium]|nr:hypothetical protein [Streptosporangiaceae bacterium]